MANIFKRIIGAHEKEEKFKELKKLCTEYKHNSERLKDLAMRLYKKRKEYGG